MKRLITSATEADCLLRSLRNTRKSITFHNVIARRNQNGKLYYYIRFRSRSHSKELAVTGQEYRQEKAKKLYANYLDILIDYTEKYRKFILNNKTRLNEAWNNYVREVSPLLVTPKSDEHIFLEDYKKYKTNRGEYVRSKTEVIMANILYSHKLDYTYEPIIPGTNRRPDFIVEHSILGYPVIFEHFGCLSDPGYLADALTKIQEYASIGYTINENFIVTYELYSDDGTPIIEFDSKHFEQQITDLFQQ